MQHEFCFVVEQNRDAQLRSLLTLETRVPKDEAALGAGLRRLPAQREHVVDRECSRDAS